MRCTVRAGVGSMPSPTTPPGRGLPPRWAAAAVAAVPAHQVTALRTVPGDVVGVGMPDATVGADAFHQMPVGAPQRGPVGHVVLRRVVDDAVASGAHLGPVNVAEDGLADVEPE